MTCKHYCFIALSFILISELTSFLFLYFLFQWNKFTNEDKNLEIFNLNNTYGIFMFIKLERIHVGSKVKV